MADDPSCARAASSDAGEGLLKSNAFQKHIEATQRELKGQLREHYEYIKKVENELARLQLELKLNVGPRKMASEFLRAKIEAQNEVLLDVRRRHAETKQVLCHCEEDLTREEKAKERLCSELNLLVAESTSAQLAKLEELKNHLDMLNGWGSRLSSTNATSAEAESICQKAHAFASSAGVASISPPPLPLSPSNANHTPSPSSTNVDMAAQDTSEGKKKALNTNGSRPSKLSDEPAAPSTTNSENHQPPHSPSLQSQQEPPSSSCSTTAAAAAAAAVYHAQGEGVVNRGGTQGNEATSAPPAPASRASGGTRGRGRKPVASHNLLPDVGAAGAQQNGGGASVGGITAQQHQQQGSHGSIATAVALALGRGSNPTSNATLPLQQQSNKESSSSLGSIQEGGSTCCQDLRPGFALERAERAGAAVPVRSSFVVERDQTGSSNKGVGGLFSGFDV